MEKLDFFNNDVFCNFFDWSWKEWIDFNLSHSDQWTIIFGVAIWHIWNARNKVVFDGLMHRHSHIASQILVDLDFTNKALQNLTLNTPPSGTDISNLLQLESTNTRFPQAQY